MLLLSNESLWYVLTPKFRCKVIKDDINGYIVWTEISLQKFINASFSVLVEWCKKIEGCRIVECNEDGTFKDGRAELD